MTESKRRLLRMTTPGEAWESMAIGHPGILVLGTTGMVVGSANVHASSKCLGSSKSNWIPLSTPRIPHGSLDF